LRIAQNLYKFQAVLGALFMIIDGAPM